MRIGIPIWDDRISPVLDTASRLLVVEMEGNNERSRFEIYMDEHELSRRCFRIQSLEVDTLICGAVSHPFARMLTANGIHLISDISGPTEDVLKAYQKGVLLDSEFLMPGCKRRRGGRKERWGPGRQSCGRSDKAMSRRQKEKTEG